MNSSGNEVFLNLLFSSEKSAAEKLTRIVADYDAADKFRQRDMLLEIARIAISSNDAARGIDRLWGGRK
mgnify:FL=1